MYKKPINFNTLLKIFMQDSKPPIVHNRRLLVKACVLSKQTIIKDFESESNKSTIFSEAEFLEVWARIVDIGSQETAMEDQFLYKKMDSVMD